MTKDSLTEKVALIIASNGACMEPDPDDEPGAAILGEYVVIDADRKLADLVLAALGLDDMDAAVERGAAAIHGGKGCTCRLGAKGDARAVLEAALTATETGCVDCGQPMRGDVLKECQNPECGMYAGSKGDEAK